MKKDKKKNLQYKPMVGFEGFYQVSEEGDIWSIRRQKHISVSDNGDGYKMFIACRDGERIPKLVHRVVAEAFIGPIGEDQEVNHKREKSNNAYWNLQILTHWEHKRFHTGANNGNFGKHKSAQEIQRRTRTRKIRRLQKLGLL